MLFQLCLSADSSTYPITDRTMQTLLMHEFFKNLEDITMMHLSRDHPESDVCASWLGLTCADGVLTAIVYSNLFRKPFGQPSRGDAKDFAMHFIPPTVRNLRINYCEQKGQVKMRNFPREAQYIDISVNLFCGVLDLTGLPPKLEDFRYAQNAFVGPINLTQLPHALHSLFIESNEIVQKVVFYSNIPPGINTISLRGMRIGELRGVYPEDSARGRNLFNIPHARIR